MREMCAIVAFVRIVPAASLTTRKALHRSGPSVTRASSANPRKAAAALTRLAELTPEQLLDASALAAALGMSARADVDEQHVRPKGYRLLHRVPLLPGTVINRLVDRFGTVKGLLGATEQQLDDVDGVGALRARAIRDGLRRLRERAVL